MMPPLECRLEPVVGDHTAVRAVLLVDGRTIATRDAFVSKGRISPPADYLATLIEDNNHQGRSVNLSAEWITYTVGAYTLRARLSAMLRGFLERSVA